MSQDLSFTHGPVPKSCVRSDAAVAILEKQSHRLLLYRFFGNWAFHHRLSKKSAGRRESSELADDLSAIEQQLHHQLAQAQANTLRTPHQQHVVLLSSIESMRRTVAKQREIILSKDQSIVSLTQRLNFLQQTMQARQNQQNQQNQQQQQQQQEVVSVVAPAAIVSPRSSSEPTPKKVAKSPRDSSSSNAEESIPVLAPESTSDSIKSPTKQQAAPVDKHASPPPPAPVHHTPLQHQQNQEQQQKGLVVGLGASSSSPPSPGTARRAQDNQNPPSPQQQGRSFSTTHQQQAAQHQPPRPATTSAAMSSSSSASSAAGSVVTVSYGESKRQQQQPQNANNAAAAVSQARLSGGGGIKLAGAPANTQNISNYQQQQQHLLFFANDRTVKKTVVPTAGTSGARSAGGPIPQLHQSGNTVVSVLVGAPTVGASATGATAPAGKPFAGGIQGTKTFAESKQQQQQQQGQGAATPMGTGLRPPPSVSAAAPVGAPGLKLTSSRGAFREL